MPGAYSSRMPAKNSALFSQATDSRRIGEHRILMSLGAPALIRANSRRVSAGFDDGRRKTDFQGRSLAHHRFALYGLGEETEGAHNLPSKDVVAKIA